MARPYQLRHPRPPAFRRCLVCGLASTNAAGILVAACRLRRGGWMPRQDGEPRRELRGTSLAVGLCAVCLREAMRDGRIARSPLMERLVTTAG